MKTNVQVQRRETKSYEVEPRVAVDNGVYQIIIDKAGMYVLQFDPAADWFSRRTYNDKPIDLKLVELALEWWKEIQ